jgi:hypothetical protein
MLELIFRRRATPTTNIEMDDFKYVSNAANPKQLSSVRNIPSTSSELELS